MNDTISKAIDEAIDNITTSGDIGYCKGSDGAIRDDIEVCADGYAWYPDRGVPFNPTMDSWVTAALMKDGRLCLVDGGGDWELVEGDNVGAQGIAALESLVPCMPNDDKYEYQRDYLDEYITNAKYAWLGDILARLYEKGVDDEELDAAVTKAYTDDDEDSILYILDHIEDVVDILGRL